MTWPTFYLLITDTRAVYLRILGWRKKHSYIQLRRTSTQGWFTQGLVSTITFAHETGKSFCHEVRKPHTAYILASPAFFVL